jgi:hypothetical protein
MTALLEASDRRTKDPGIVEMLTSAEAAAPAR